MAEIWALLGDIEFTTDMHPKSFRHDRAIALAEHPIILALPRHQHTGRKPETLDLTMRFSSNWCDPSAQLRQLWRALDEVSPMRLVLGDGLFKKSFLITRVQTTLERTNRFGDTEAIECTVSLVETVAAPYKKRVGFAVRQRRKMAIALR